MIYNVAIFFLFIHFSAQLLSATSSHTEEYSLMLKEQFQGNLLILSIVCILVIVWTVFIIFYSSKKWKYMPHAQTMLLLAFQACQCGGVLLSSFLDLSVVWKRYLQVYILAVGSYGTRINVCIIGVAMLMLTKGKARIVSKLQPYILIFGSIAPPTMATILVATSTEEINNTDILHVDTGLLFGFYHKIVMATTYGTSMVIVVACLILSQMHYKKRKPDKNQNLGRGNGNKVKDGQSVLAVGKKVSDLLGFRDALPDGAALEDCCQWKDGRKRSKNERDCQMVRHTILLLYQSVLMFVGKSI